jgi:hypothetical protein
MSLFLSVTNIMPIPARPRPEHGRHAASHLSQNASKFGVNIFGDAVPMASIPYCTIVPWNRSSFMQPFKMAGGRYPCLNVRECG